VIDVFRHETEVTEDQVGRTASECCIRSR